MNIEIRGTKYQIRVYRDSERDGKYMEASIPGTEPLQQVMKVFYSNRTMDFSISCADEEVPLELVEFLIGAAKSGLPDNKD